MNKNKKMIIFDLDNTLNVSKSNITPKMANLLVQLFEKYMVCIISGGAYPQFRSRVLDQLRDSNFDKSRLHLMPTCGTKYYKYDTVQGDWVLQYNIELSKEQRDRIIHVLEEGAKELGYWGDDTYGDIIEDRGSQVTFSALGQLAPADEKLKWDPTGDKKQKLRNYVANELTDLEVRVGGSTSVDVTMEGIDKAYGVRKLMELINLKLDDLLFIGDRTVEGGNDYPIKAMGVETIEVKDHIETEGVIQDILNAR